MRVAGFLALLAVAPLLLAPSASATSTPVLVWPDAQFVDLQAAPNLTAWIAGRAGLAPDPSHPSEWRPVQYPLPPSFASPNASYHLPVEGGEVSASYTPAGFLWSSGIAANTSYVAASVDLAAFEAVATEFARAIGLDVSFAGAGVGVPGPGVPEDERMWMFFVDQARLEPGGKFFAASAAFRESDRRLVGFSASIYHTVEGAPDLDAAGAVSLALQYARSRHNATDPRGEIGPAFVRNESSFAYQVYVRWAAETPDRLWSLDMWIDTNSGEVVEISGPFLGQSPVDTGQTALLPSPGFLFGLGAVFAVLGLVGAVLFFRVSAQRALDHFTRGQIYGYVVANPGVHYNALRQALTLPNGTLAYHLWVLERTGYLRSVRERRNRHLYAEGTPIRRGSVVLSRLQLTILDQLHGAGPQSQSELARRLGVSRQRAHYNVKVLRSLGLVKSVEAGGFGLSVRGAEMASEGNRHPTPPTTSEG